MKAVKIILGVLVLLVVVALALQTVASESGEVVVLGYTDESGVVHETRLWVVDHQGQAWLRSGQATSGWATRLGGNAQVVVTREGQTNAYQAVAAPEMATLINDLMLKKYGWREQIISAMFGSRDGSLPLRLEPMVDPANASH